MSEINKIFNRVAKWNEQRYDRQYNLALTCSLLREEYQELLESVEDVHKLDAYCDLIYVAMGGLWKLDLGSGVFMNSAMDSATFVHNLMDANVLMPKYYIPSFIDALEHDLDLPMATVLHTIINLCIAQIHDLDLSLDDIYDALNIVCDSNDSKSIPSDKVDPTVKANINKGTGFIAPEPRLQALLDKRVADGDFTDA